jgi:hypothetical protein
MTGKHTKLREAEHPGAKALARIEAALKPDPTKNVATWSEYQVATLSHNLADVLKYVAAEKARADAAEDTIVSLRNGETRLSLLLNENAREAVDTISTLTAERDALKRERDEARDQGVSVGIALSVAYLMRDVGEDTYAEEWWRAAGLTVDQCESLGMDEYDLGPIRELVAHMAARSALSDANAAEREDK